MIALEGVLVGMVGLAVAVAAALFAYPAFVRWLADRDAARFLDGRRYLKANRLPLAWQAIDCYHLPAAVEDVPLLAGDGWVPDLPIPLECLSCHWEGTDVPVATPASGLTRLWPRTGSGPRYPTYVRAVDELDRPKLFENRPCYRLLQVAPSHKGCVLRVGTCWYFDYLDTGEALGYELALATMRGSSRPRQATSPAFRSLPGRKAIGNPLDLVNRNVVPGINTLTIRSDGRSPTFFMHRRDSQAVASAMGVYHVAPAGEFQPTSVDPDVQAWKADMDPWLTIMREYNEEFLGAPDAAVVGGAPVDYSVEPYRSLNEARQTGSLRAYFLGVTLDPLSLKGEVLTVCVIEAAAFGRLFGGMVSENAEGKLVVGHDKVGVPFDAEHVTTYLHGKGVATLPAGGGCLALAWQHRQHLLPGAAPEGSPAL